jgi:hypothetical protein
LSFYLVGQYSTIKPSIPLNGGKTIPFHSLFGQVEFKNIDFTYPTRQDQVMRSENNPNNIESAIILYKCILPIESVEKLFADSSSGQSCRFGWQFRWR